MVKFKAFLKRKNKIVDVKTIHLYNSCIVYEDESNEYFGVDIIYVEDFKDIELLPSLGFKDRNNTEIFLYDIVKYLGDEIGIVKYDLGCFIIEFDSYELSFYNNLGYDNSEIEVIGNYYTDSYLLDPYLDFLKK